MSTALTIVLLTIAERDISDPFTPAVTRATREALGAETLVVTRNVAALPSDTAAATLGTELHADAVVEVTWTLPDHLRATIHLRRSSTGRWVDREIGFGPADDPVERSRTIGFTVASMLPEHLLAASPTPASSRPENPSPPSDEGARQVGRAPAEATHPPSSIGAMFVAGLGVRDYGGGMGGGLDFRAGLGHRLSLRIAGGARIGQDPPAQIVTLLLQGAAGLAWDTWISRDARGAFGLRFDVVGSRADFSHTSPVTDTTEHQTKWMPGADLMLEASYFFTHGVAVAAGAGAGAFFGRTDVVVEGQRVTTLQPVHPVLELGLRAGF